MPPALTSWEAEYDVDGDDDLFIADGNRRSSARAPRRVTRASVAQQGQVAARSGTNGNDNNAEEEEEEAGEHDEQQEDDYDDDSDAAGVRGFVGKPKLPEHQFARRSLHEIMDLLNSPYLNLNPEYQRDVVWKRTRMSGLIDSLMENFYVPPVIFNVEPIQLENGSVRWKRTCVDGKQRLTSIRDFMKGRIPCHDRRGATWHYCDKEEEDGRTVRTAGRRILPEWVRLEFRNKALICYEFMNLTDAQERDLFQRVQKGVQLTKAEQFRATRGAWQEFAELYELDFPKVVNLTTNSRASGFRNVLTCFSQIYECQDPSSANGVPVLRASIGALEAFLKNEPALNGKTRDHLRRVFALYNDLVEEDLQTFKNNSYVRVKTFAPIELVAVSVLLSQHGFTRPRGMLLGDIRALRDHLRSKHVDLRMNKEVWSSAWEFIDDLEGQRGTLDGTTAPRRKAKPRQPKRAARAANPLSPADAAAYTPTMSSALKPALGRGPVVTMPIMSSNRQPSLIEQLAEPALRPSESVPIARREGEGVTIPNLDGADDHGRSPSPAPSAADSLIGLPEPQPMLEVKQEPDRMSPPLPPPKRRIDLDLGTGSTGARALMAKKARLMGK